MNPAADPAEDRLKFHGTRATSVITQRVPPALADAFMEWERGIAAAARECAGYQGTEIYPPTAPGEDQWVVLLHFDDPDSLRKWFDSPARHEWIARLPSGINSTWLRTLPTGFGPWFAAQFAGIAAWKMFLTVLLGLYPTVMVLSILVMPVLKPLGTSFAILISNAMSAAILQWAVMPLLQALLRPWLRAAADRAAVAAGGAAAIIACLVGFALLFQRIHG